MRVGIIGGGVVGQATARSYLEHVEEVRVYDALKERRTHDLAETMQCDLVFVCLPTPQLAGGIGCDLDAIESTFNAMTAAERQRNLVLRSTVPVGTTRRLRGKYNLPNLVHSPEFLTARCAMVDAQMPARNVIGNPGYPGNAGRDAALVLQELYETRFPSVPCLRMNSDDSEAVKLFQNAFFATKVSFWNECRAFADAAGLDWERVMSAILADGRIHPNHTKVPGPDGKYGFGGSCLPKDLASLIDQIEKTAGIAAPIMRAANHRNEGDRKR